MHQNLSRGTEASSIVAVRTALGIFGGAGGNRTRVRNTLPHLHTAIDQRLFGGTNDNGNKAS